LLRAGGTDVAGLEATGAGSSGISVAVIATPSAGAPASAGSSGSKSSTGSSGSAMPTPPAGVAVSPAPPGTFGSCRRTAARCFCFLVLRAIDSRLRA
jgi:hypothetical protein